jgi:hypothetical protein
VVKLSIVRTVPENLNMTTPRSKVALETRLAELHRIFAVSDMGSAFLALQITELEDKCAALRKRMDHKAKANCRAEGAAPCVLLRNS